jgi:hypothetical protein
MTAVYTYSESTFVLGNYVSQGQTKLRSRVVAKSEVQHGCSQPSHGCVFTGMSETYPKTNGMMHVARARGLSGTA